MTLAGGSRGLRVPIEGRVRTCSDRRVDLFERAGAAQDRGGAEETLEGTVERIVYSGGDGEFTVARFKLERGAVVTVVGSLLGIPAGAALRVQGCYESTAR